MKPTLYIGTSVLLDTESICLSVMGTLNRGRTACIPAYLSEI